jgi:hypothetical protein
MTAVFAFLRQVTIGPSAVLILGTPRDGATVSQGFMVGGWAADFRSATGGGIDIVHAYAYPGAGESSFRRRPGERIASRSGAAFGARFGTAGFNLFAPPLPAGRYRIVAYGRSLVAGTFAVATPADVTVQ